QAKGTGGADVMPGLMLLIALALNADQPAPRVRESRLDTVLQWNEHALEAIRRDRTAPPLAARNLAVLHAAIADAVNTVHQKHQASLVRLRADDPSAADVAAAVTAHRVLVGLYPRQRGRLDDLLDRALAAIPSSPSKTRGVSLGRYVAAHYLRWRRDDTRER